MRLDSGRFVPAEMILMCAAADQESESTQRLPSVDDGRSSPKVSNNPVAVEPQDNV